MVDQKTIKKISNLSHKEWDKVSYLYVKFKQKKFDKKAGLKDLRDIKNILDEEKIDFWVIGGTLLGIVRDGDFIKWDNDIDIAICLQPDHTVFDRDTFRKEMASAMDKAQMPFEILSQEEMKESNALNFMLDIAICAKKRQK